MPSAKQGSCECHFLKSFATRGMNPRSTHCETDALTTTPSRRLIEVRLNNIIYLITWSRKCDQVSNLYKKLNLLKISDIYKLGLSKFMHQLSRSGTPPVFENYFFKFEQSRSYDTRQLKRNTFCPVLTNQLCIISWQFGDLNYGLQ